VHAIGICIVNFRLAGNTKT